MTSASNEPRERGAAGKARGCAVVPLTAEEVRSIASNTPEHVRAAVVLAAGTGRRHGEVFGLSADGVDFMRRESRATASSGHRASGRPVLKTPKSKTGYRTVALSSLVDTLAIHLRAFGTGEDGLVFHIARRPMVRAMASKYVRRAAKTAELPGHGWHDLRHLLATNAHVIRNDDERVRSVIDASLSVSAEYSLSTEAV